MSANADTANPPQIARRSGVSEKLSAPLKASRTILKNGYLVSPAARGWRWKGTSVWAEPSQADMAGPNALASEVARQRDVAVARIVLGLGLEHDAARVAAAVVDEDRFRRGVEFAEQRVQPLEEHRQHRLLVEHGDDQAVADWLGRLFCHGE